jgi:uncharacterized protein YjdB
MKLHALLFSILLSFSTSAMFAQNSTRFTVGDFGFSTDVKDNYTTCTLTSYTGSGGAVTIPSAVTGTLFYGGVTTGLTDPIPFEIHPQVTGIASSAFRDCIGLTSVSIPNSVTSIGSSAFRGCIGLTSVAIPNGVTSIGEHAFYGCTNLASVSIPTNVTSIGNYTFYGCTSLTSVTIPNNVTSIGFHAFRNCMSLTSVSIPNSVTSIGNYAFYGCTSLTSVSIPNSVTGIGDYTFYGCTSLTSVTIPTNVTRIGWCAFRNCTSLTSVTIPNSVTSIVNSAFGKCTGLTDITVSWATPLDIDSDGSTIFSDVNKTACTLHVPAGTEALYKAASVWKDFYIPSASALTVSPSTLEFVAGGESKTFTVTSNIIWTVGSNASWATASPSSGSGNGTVTVTAVANTTGSSRTATITLTGGGITQTVSITQTATTLTALPNTLSFIAAGESKTFTVTSNANWTVGSNASWATVSPSSGSNNGTVTVTATANTIGSSRPATITLTGGGMTQTVSITQTAATLTVLPNTLSFIAAGESKTFTVTSNVNWTVSNFASWLTVSPSSGSNDGTVTVTAAENTSTDPRLVTITISSDGVASQTVYITQPAATLSVSPATLEFVAENASKTFNVTSNVSWTVSSNAAWAMASPSSGSNNGEVTVTVAKNTIGSSRTATITVSTAGGSTRTVNITQAAPTLTVSTTALEFSKSGGPKTINVTSNVNWTVSSSVSWLSFSPSSGSINNSLSIPTITSMAITAAENTTGGLRTATVTVSGGGLTRTISVEQHSNTSTFTVGLEVSKTALDFAAAGGSDVVNVTYVNTSWTAVCSASWLTVSPTSGSNNNLLSIPTVTPMTVTAAANTGNARTATITISGSGITSKTVSVTQAAAVNTPVPVSGVTLNTSTQSLAVGQTFLLTATVSPANATNKAVTWSSNNTSIAEVNASGQVTAKATGTATIMVTTVDGNKKATCAVTVVNTSVPVSGVTLNTSTQSLAVGQTFLLTATVSPANATNNAVTWSSSDTLVAEVNASGLVTAKAAGTATITVTTADGGKKATCVIESSGDIGAITVGLSVLPTFIDFEAAGGTKTVTVSATNVSWTVVSDVSWLTLSPSSGSNSAPKEYTVTVTATPNDSRNDRSATIILTGGNIIQTISVTQDAVAGQGVAVYPANPVNQRGTITLSLLLPSDATSTGSFVVTLPHGFYLDINGSALSNELAAVCLLSMTPQGNESWLFKISLNTSRHSVATYRKIMDIAYTTDESVNIGSHEARITDLVLTLSDGTVIREDEIKVDLTATPTGILAPDQEVKVFAYNGVLTVNTPAAERIDIYSFTGIPVFSAPKTEGTAIFIIGNLHEKTLIVRGSSGWVRKIANVSF